jgi:hypothetical protein
MPTPITPETLRLDRERRRRAREKLAAEYTAAADLLDAADDDFRTTVALLRHEAARWAEVTEPTEWSVRAGR